MTTIDKPKITDNGAYHAGKSTAANIKVLTQRHLRRLKADADYWQGFHDERPSAHDRFQTTILEDPTRPGGWCHK